MRRFFTTSLLLLAVACTAPTSPETAANGVRAENETGAQLGRPATRVVAPRPAPRTIPLGGWGGDHLRLLLTETEGTLEYDCAHGTIDEPFVVDSAGRFVLRGTHTREHGGPIRRDEKPDEHPARYTGATDGKTMTLSVKLTDSNESVGIFTLTRGRPGRVVRCL